MLGCVAMEQLPVPGLPEIAFAGRSNVGKSSLINALTGRKTLARTSNTPGRTREINFFEFENRLRLVDMPGYGFAKVPKPMVEGWTQLIHDYLRGRAVLRRLCVLVDSRHGLKPNDEQLMTMLDKAAVNYRVILTKTDKLGGGGIRRGRGGGDGSPEKASGGRSGPAEHQFRKRPGHRRIARRTGKLRGAGVRSGQNRTGDKQQGSRMGR